MKNHGQHIGQGMPCLGINFAATKALRRAREALKVIGDVQYGDFRGDQQRDQELDESFNHLSNAVIHLQKLVDITR